MVYKALSAMLVVLAIATGCASSPAAAPTSLAGQPKIEATKPAAEQSKPASDQDNPAAKTASGPSGTLVSAISTFGADTMDPILGGWATVLSGPLFEYLMDNDDKGNLKPRLADSWTPSDDGKTWTFKIHKGVMFHNGDEMTSADVKFSLDRLMSKESLNPWTAIYRGAIASYDTPDPYTFIINLKAPDFNFANAAAAIFVMPKKYTEEKGVDYFAKNPVGTGPWKLTKFTPSQTVEYEAVKDHWFKIPAFEKLVVKNVPDESTRMAMLKRGDVDIIGLSLDSTDAAKAAGFDIRLSTSPTQVFMMFPGTWQNTSAPVMDVRIRHALSLAINRDEMVNTFFKGMGKAATRSWMAEFSWGYNLGWKPDPYDPQKAKQLLAEAGYPSKFSDPTVPIYSYQLAGAPWLPAWAEIVSGYWESIGVKTKIVPIDGALIRTMYTAKPVDPKVVGDAVAYQGSGAFFSFYNSVNLYKTGGNVELIKDKSMDDLMNQVPLEKDEDKRKQIYQQVMDKAHDQYVDIQTVNVPAAFAVSKQIGDFPIPMSTLERAYEGIKRK